MMPAARRGVKTIVPSLAQANPRSSGASHSVIGGPPRTEIFFSMPSWKNASHSPSGEKTGITAAVTPGD